LVELDSPKHVRTAYLSLLEPKGRRDRTNSRNTPEHALARAAAFLPTQYAATRAVVGELNSRLGGGLVGPVLELSGTLGAGFWAVHDAVGPEPLNGYTLVHRTRWGLDLAQRFAASVPGHKDFKRDFTFIEMARPQVAMSTFALSELPTKLGRINHLNELLSVGAEHIVIVDRSSDAVWEAMKHAREYLLRQSTPERPLHVTAPCAGDGGCPRADGKEACAFGQRLQRPTFLRKTKHTNRGDEIVPYTYLIVSRGKRPEAAETEELVGRIGAVGKEDIERQLMKETGRTVLQQVEGGEHGAFEAVAVPASEDVIEVDIQAGEEATAHLRAEAYAWPRIVSPTLKRSGHVVVDVCTKDGELQRMRVAKSHGKQIYYDARRLDWGDQYPHQPKGKVEMRTRGIRRLTKVDHSAAEEELDEMLAEINRKDEDDVVPEAAMAEDAAPRPTAVEDEQFRSTGDAELDALLRSMGATNFGAELVPETKPQAPRSKRTSKGAANKRSYSSSAREDEFYFKEDVEEDCAPGEDSFAQHSLSDPDYVRPADKPYVSARPKRPEQPITPNPDSEPASVGEGGWSRWSLSDPPIRSEEDVEFYFKEDVDADCAPGEESFSQHSLSDPDYQRKEPLEEYNPPRPKRPDPLPLPSNAEPASAGEGGWSSWSLSDPPYRSSGVGSSSGSKRSYSTSARRFSARPRLPPVGLSPRLMSVAPSQPSQASSSRPKLNVLALESLYRKNEPITVLTAYDYPTALLCSRAGVDVILVGDSLAQVALGYPSTVPLTLDEMAHHVRAVSRGAGSSFVLVDLPFGHAEVSVAEGVRAAVALMKAGADGIKIEGGEEMLPLVKRLSETGIAVMSHIGLQPQRVASMGYKAQGKSAAAAADLIDTAKACEAAGSFGLLLEAIPQPVATAVTQATSIPTIGIGAGNGCSGQVLVLTDMLATYDTAVDGEVDTFKVPKFVRTFGNVGKQSRAAVDAYISAVRSRDFPASPKETYAMPKDQLEEFRRLVAKE
jgi:3-methyl-2-oxobutanoate hydroxymethyltransferase